MSTDTVSYLLEEVDTVQVAADMAIQVDSTQDTVVVVDRIRKVVPDEACSTAARELWEEQYPGLSAPGTA